MRSPPATNLVPKLALAFRTRFSTVTVEKVDPNVRAGVRGTLLPVAGERLGLKR
jgi:hypothetical protein